MATLPDFDTLIQVKQSSSSVGVDAVQESVSARAFYGSYFGEPLGVAVVSNAVLTPSARDLAEIYGGELPPRPERDRMLQERGVTIAHVALQERARLSSV